MITVNHKQQQFNNNKKSHPSIPKSNKNQLMMMNKKRPLEDAQRESKKRVRILEGNQLMNDNKINNNIQLSKTVYKTYLTNAFDALEKNNDTNGINNIAAKIALPSSLKDSLSFPILSIILKYLTLNISKLDSKNCNTIIMAFIDFPNWAKLPDDNSTLEKQDFIKNYVTFLTVLTSSTPSWHNEIVEKLIEDFIKYPSINDLRFIEESKRTKYKSTTKPHHDYLKFLIRVIPTSLTSILKCLIRSYPDKNCRKFEIINYTSNLFEIMTYAKEIKHQLLSSIIEYCIKLDVELKNSLDEVDDDDDDNISDDEESDDEDEEDEEEEVDDDEDVSKSDDEVLEDDDGEEEYNIDLSFNINKLKSKLDHILEKIFLNLEDEFNSENINTSETINLYKSLVRIFQSYILSTSNTKSIQFLIFYFSQKNHGFIEEFLTSLIEIIFNFDENLEKRIKSVQYLASYLSRAKHITKEQLVFIIDYLINWSERFVAEREWEINSKNSNGGMERFKQFYAVIQCLLYTFCFRHKDLKKLNNDWECSIDKFFQKIILTKFNPLRFINETVVSMFAKIAHQENVAYCFSIIEHNRRDQFQNYKNVNNNKNNNGSGSGLINDSRIMFFSKQEFLDLVAYFPFDPMLLKRCNSIIVNDYIEWSNNQEHDDFSDSNSDDYDDGSSYAKEFVRKNSVLISEESSKQQVRQNLKVIGQGSHDNNDVFEEDSE